MSVLEMRGLKVLLYYGLVLVELVLSEGGGVASFGRKFRMEKVSPYQPFLAWSVSGLSSAVEPPDAPLYHVNDVSRFVFRAVSHQGGNVLIIVRPEPPPPSRRRQLYFVKSESFIFT